MAVAHSRIGLILLFAGHPQEAVTEFDAELNLFQKSYDSKDRGARGNLADRYINLGHVEARAGNLTRGLQLLRHGKDLLSTLRKAEWPDRYVD